MFLIKKKFYSLGLLKDIFIDFLCLREYNYSKMET